MNPCINCSFDSQGCHESGFCNQCPYWTAWKAELAIFKAGFYLEDDEDFLYLKRNGKQVAVWNSTKVTTPTILEEMNRIIATERVFYNGSGVVIDQSCDGITGYTTPINTKTGKERF